MKGNSKKRGGHKNFCNSSDVPDNQKCNNDSKGKILRIKHGYNPNSSSIGSIVFALPAALLGITAGFGVVSGIIMSAFMKDTGKSNSEKARTSEKPCNIKESTEHKGE